MSRGALMRGSFVVAVDTVPMALHQLVALGKRQVLAHHLGNEIAEPDFRLPAELAPGLRGVAEQRLDLGGPEVARIDRDDAAPIHIAFFPGTRAAPAYLHADLPRGRRHEVAHAVLL